MSVKEKSRMKQPQKIYPPVTDFAHAFSGKLATVEVSG